ncbi:MAG TPA: hypothetical protein VL442_02380 [Mucilaginibacter sp.]|jgi:hypothetical protein|nr:hypothetical protein [Mucilaginibacter sp.]
MNAINPESFHKKDYDSNGKEREILRLSDLDMLIGALLICMDNYEQLAKVAVFPEVKAICKHYADQRAAFAAILYLRLGQYDRLSIDEQGCITGQTRPAWVNTSCTTNEADDDILMNSIINNELSAIKKYDDYLRSHIPVIRDLHLLVSQQDSIKRVIKPF